MIASPNAVPQPQGDTPWKRCLLHPVAQALFGIVLTHLPFWLVQFRLFELRPIFSYDLLAVLLVGAVLRRPLVGMVLLCWILDGIQSIATSFHFDNALEFAGALRFAKLLRFGEFLSASTAGLIALFLSAAALLLYGLRRLRIRAAAVLSLAIIIVGADVANGSTRIPGFARDAVLTTVNIAGSPLWNMYHRLKASRESSDAGPTAWRPAPVSYTAARDWMSSHPRGSVLVILVESMGLPRSPALHEALIAPLRSALPTDRWDIESSQEGFSGGTTHGELRVLCGLDGRYQSVRDGQADVSPCLPRQLAQRGHASVGMHGFTAQMFDRQQWWSQIGFGQRLFAEELAHPANRCGEAFQGVCDRALVQEAVKHLGPEPRFVYALTLNTHLPLRATAIDPRFQPLCTSNNVPTLPCLLLARQVELMRDIADAVGALPAATLVVIAGDHAPPFGDVRDRAAFSTDSVPVFLVRPRP